MSTNRTGDGRFDDAFADDALLALSMMATFAACAWYEERSKNAPPGNTGKARS